MTHFAYGRLLGALFLLLPLLARAQQPFGLELTTDIPVLVGPDTLRHAWAGGLNVAAFSKMDFDADGTPDLLVWDAAAQRPMTFVARAGRWRHAPAYEAAFPATPAYFALLRDFDGDQRPDLWAVERQYVALYRNVPAANGFGFAFQLVSRRLQTEPAPQPQPLMDIVVASYATLSVEDVDADGDLDLLTYDPASFGLTLHRNTAGAGGQPTFREELTWGGITRCGGCQRYAFAASGTNCRPLHAFPAFSLLAADLDGDGDRDVLTGSEYCRTLDVLRNGGTTQQPYFTTGSVTTVGAGAAGPVQLSHAPAAFYEDVTFDGQPDLLTVPWLVLPPTMAADLYDTRRSVRLYPRTGAGLNGFRYQQDDFLQDAMIDAGENAVPTLGDLDGDGDLDLLVGNLADFVPSSGSSSTAPARYRAHLRFYRNVGSRTQPVFQLEDSDFGRLDTANLRAVAPVLTDLDGNGALDLVIRYSADALGFGTRPLGFILNGAPAGQLASFQWSNLQTFDFGIIDATSPRDLPCFFDVDGDGDRDIILGTYQQPASLRLIRNQGGPLTGAFVLADSDFGRLPGGYSAWRGVSPAVGDFDGDGRPELLTADDSGELRVWPQLLSNPTNPTPSTSQLVRNPLTRVFGPANFGFRPALTTGDLNGDGRPEVLVGTAGGGIRLLRHQSQGILSGLSDAATRLPLEVWPNPAAEQFTVSAGRELVTFELLDLLGRLVVRQAAPSVAPTCRTADLPAGTYLLRVRAADGREAARRVVVPAHR